MIELFVIYGGKQNFTQWDLNQFVTNPCMQEGDEVVFYNSHGATYVVNAFAQDGEILADVPNYLLQMEGNILVDLGQGLERHTECRTTFTVVAQPKPEGYDCQYNVPDRPVKNGGVSSWNDLQDIPESVPYIEDGGTVEILPEYTIAGAGDLETFPYIGIVVGNKYRVVVNGIPFDCTAVEFVLEEGHYVALGDIYTFSEGLYGTAATGEPFVIIEPIGEAVNVLGKKTQVVPLSADLTFPVIVSIHSDGVTIHKLDNRCLDLAWLPTFKETSWEEVLDTQTLNNPVTGSGSYIMLLLSDLGELIVGETYIVNWSGVEYRCVAYTVGAFAEAGYVFLGDFSRCSDDDFAPLAALGAGEPFGICYNPDPDSRTVYWWDNSSVPTVSIQHIITEPNPLPAKFLPTDATELYLTSPGGKKFKITVSDDGVLSASAV